MANMNHVDLARMIEESPERVIYGFTVKWTDFGGGAHEVHETGFHSALEARRSVIRAARAAGWTYPRWFEWWRWRDTRPDMEGVAIAQQSEGVENET